ncbi:MAG: hypothetical protein QM607_03905 [Microbacterium sp.]
MGWVEAVPAILVACVVVVGPGMVVLAPLHLRLVARVALSGLVTVVCSGVAAIVFGAVGLAFSWWQVLLVAVLGFGGCWLLRGTVPRADRTPRRGLLVAVWAVTAVVIGVVAFAGVRDPDRISQTYDNVFHLSAVSAILDGFSASPLTLRSLIETDNPGLAYYPAAWHQLVAMTAQLSGASVPVCFTAVWLAVQALIWLPGIAWLAQTVVPALVPERVEGAALVALPLGAAFGAFPYALLSWGTIYPAGLAYSLLPAAVALTIRALQRGKSGGVRVAAILLAVAAIGLAHPRVLPTWAVVLVPFVVWRLARLYVAAYRGGRRRTAVTWLVSTLTVLVVLAVGAITVAITRFGLLDEPVADRLNGPQAMSVQGFAAGILQVIGGMAMTGEGPIVTAFVPLLGAALAVGIVVAAREPRTRWLVCSFVIVAALFVLAAGSDGVAAKLATGIWYKDRFRLAAATPLTAIPLATLGIMRVASLLTPAKSRITALGLSGIVAASAAVCLFLTGSTSAIQSVFVLPPQGAQWQIVSQKQIDFMQTQVSDMVPDGQLVLGDPWDGSALTELYAGRRAVFPHVNGQWDADRLVLAWHLQSIDENPEVCAALDRLGVRYVLYNPHTFGGGDPSGNHFPGPHAAVEAGLFTPVASDGESTLYEITQCGPLPAAP